MDLDPASRSFAERHGRHCAAIPWTALQVILALVVGGAVTTALICWPVPAWTVISYCLALFFSCYMLLRLVAAGLALVADPAIHIDVRRLTSVADADLPRYTVLVPLYREPEVVPQLLAAMRQLDYPSDRLQIRFLLEPDDAATRAAFAAEELAPWMELVVAPDGDPRTKPRACNAALVDATGDLLVIFDAEDRPEPDQLRKAAVAYAALPERVACLQCRLVHYNSRQSLAARWAAIDYLAWFGWFLPGLQRLGGPLPLGGTSNHFRTAVLRQLDGWDPFNVTEDADLGIRLARSGYRCAMLDSRTWEEAVTDLGSWVRQRSRWFKGYLQTWLVHARGGALRGLGPWGWLLMHLLIGGTVVSLLAAPVFWAVIALWLGIGWSLVDIHDDWSRLGLYLSIALLAGNAVWIGLNVLVCLAARRVDLVPAALAGPIAWGLHSLAAWRGALQFLIKPFHWDKTSHGAGVVDRSRSRRLVMVCAALVASTWLGWQLVVLVQARLDADWQRQIPETAQQKPLPVGPGEGTGVSVLRPHDALPSTVPAPPLDGPIWRCDLRPGLASDLALQPTAGLAATAGIHCDILLPAEAPEGLRVQLVARDDQGHWFQWFSDQFLLPGRWARVAFPFADDSGWDHPTHGRCWQRERLAHLDHLALQFLDSGTGYRGPAWVGGWRSVAAPEIVPEPLAWQPGPPQIAIGEHWQATIALPPGLGHPDDPADCAIDLVITDAAGQQQRRPAFSTIQRDATGAAIGRLQLAARFRPHRPGAYQAHLEGRIGDQDLPPTPPTLIEVDDTGSDPFVARIGLQWVTGDGRAIWPVPPAEDRYPGAVQARLEPADLDALAAAGCNWLRLWPTPWGLGIERPTGWGTARGLRGYDLGAADQFDRLLDHAAAIGIHIVVGLSPKAALVDAAAWQTHPYNRANGGPLATPAELFSHPEADRLVRRRIRTVLARWGDHPAIVAWELYGLADQIAEADPRLVASWHRRLATQVARLDPHDRPISTGRVDTLVPLQLAVPAGDRGQVLDHLVQSPPTTSPGPPGMPAEQNRWRVSSNDGELASLQLSCSDGWYTVDGLRCAVYLPDSAPTAIRTSLYACDEAGRSYRFVSEQPLRPGRWTTLAFPLHSHGGWRGIGHRHPWRPDARRSLSRFELRFEPEGTDPIDFWITDCREIERPMPLAVQANAGQPADTD